MSRITIVQFVILAGRTVFGMVWHFAASGGRALLQSASVLKDYNPLLLFGWAVAPAERLWREREESVKVTGSENGAKSHLARPLRRDTPRPILVTGTHRSGTTWMGRMIALAPGVHYIHEPFNPNHDRGICGAKIDRWFMYVCRKNEAPYYRDLKRMIELRYSARGKILETKSPRILPDVLRRCVGSFRLRRRHPRPLVKGPISLFSASWLASRFDMDVIVMIRHPAAFAGSLKIANWNFPFEDWVQQPLLMDDLLFPFAEEIEQQAREPHDVIDQAALLWKCMHHVILRYKAAHPEWMFVRHEDLSLDPVEGFRQIYARLGLPFTEEIERAVAEHSAPSNPIGALEHRHELKLNSRANLKTWQQRLSAEEVLRIRRQVEPVSSYLYSADTWSRN